MKFEAKQNSELSKHFIRLKDGEDVIGVFQGEPLTYYNHWDNNEKRSFLCQGETCSPCGKGDKKKFRFRLNMVVKGDNGLEAKILDGGWKLYNALSEINNDYPLDKNYTKVKRTGKTLNDTVYTPLPVKQQLTDEKLKEVSTVTLLPLDPKDPFWNKTKEETGFHQEEEVPF